MKPYPIGSVIPNGDTRPVSSQGCNLTPQPEATPEPLMTPDEQEAARLGVTVQKLQAMKAYAQTVVQNAKKGGERIKASTVRRLVASKFKIKLR